MVYYVTATLSKIGSTGQIFNFVINAKSMPDAMMRLHWFSLGISTAGGHLTIDTVSAKKQRGVDYRSLS